MAHITGFSITGLAGRDKKIDFDLDRHVNIFWGLNGSGKTSLLKILNGALSDTADPLDRVPFERADVRLHSTMYGPFKRTLDKEASTQRVRQSMVNRRLSREAQLEFDDDVISFQVEEGMKWKTTFPKGKRPQKDFGSLDHSYLPISRVADRSSAFYPGHRPMREALDEAWFDTVFARQVQRRWQAYNAEALARIREVQQLGLAEILSVLFGGSSAVPLTAAGPVESAAAYTLVSNFLRRQGLRVTFDKDSFAKRYLKESDLQEIVVRIEDVTARISEALKPQEDFNRLIGDLYTGDKQLELSARGISVKSNDAAIPLESLSSGEKQLLQILLEALSGGPNTVMIDEPELSMHVDWQSRLVDSMRTVNPECQLILATHSPEVMAPVDLSKIFEL